MYSALKSEEEFCSSSKNNADYDTNGYLIFHSVVPSNLFQVDEAGLVELTGDLYTIEPAYTVNLTVRVTDKGTPPLSDTAIVRITIEPPIPEFDATCPGPNYVDEVI